MELQDSLVLLGNLELLDSQVHQETQEGQE